MNACKWINGSYELVQRAIPTTGKQITVFFKAKKNAFIRLARSTFFQARISAHRKGLVCLKSRTCNSLPKTSASDQITVLGQRGKSMFFAYSAFNWYQFLIQVYRKLSDLIVHTDHIFLKNKKSRVFTYTCRHSSWHLNA